MSQCIISFCTEKIKENVEDFRNWNQKQFDSQEETFSRSKRSFEKISRMAALESKATKRYCSVYRFVRFTLAFQSTSSFSFFSWPLNILFFVVVSVIVVLFNFVSKHLIFFTIVFVFNDADSQRVFCNLSEPFDIFQILLDLYQGL